MLWLLYSLRKSPWYPLDRLGWHQVLYHSSFVYAVCYHFSKDGQVSENFNIKYII